MQNPTEIQFPMWFSDDTMIYESECNNIGSFIILFLILFKYKF